MSTGVIFSVWYFSDSIRISRAWVEQTFFCALNPAERPAYAKKMSELLVPGGKVAGVLFDAEFEGGPPFGGNREEYSRYFVPFFKIKTLERCYNSIKPRAGRELFMILEKGK